MKITAVGEYGVQLTHLGLINCYMVRESDGWTLIDTNLPGQGEKILAALAARGGQARRILLTHAHGDHVGSVDELQRLTGGLELAISEREVRLLRRPADLATLPGEPSNRLMARGFPGVLSAPTTVVRAGECVGSLRCFSTPGHSPGHFSYLDERDGTMYIGDAVVTLGGTPRVAGFAAWYAALTNKFTWDKPMARASVEGLRGLRVAKIASGHGRVTEGEGLIEEALNNA